MDKLHLKLLIVVIFPCIIFCQDHCENANSRIVAAYSHVKKAYDSRNITDIKYYSDRSKESFEKSQKDSEKCGCETASKKTLDAIDLLSKATNVNVYEDGRFYVKRARDIAKQVVISIDDCSYKSSNITSLTNETNATTIANNDDIIDLQQQQLELKQQQDALKAKEEKIKLQLISQQLKKNRALIAHYKSIIASNIETFNSSLSSMSCEDQKIVQSKTQAISNLDKKNSDEISLFYKQELKTLTNTYLTLLNACSN